MLALICVLVLALPKFSKPFTIDIDASSMTISVMVTQDSHPFTTVVRN